MKKVLFTANLDSFFIKFLIPQLKSFKEKGYEVHIASKSENIDIPYCDKKFDVDFARGLNIKQNIRSYKEMKEIFKNEHYDIVSTHTPFGGAITRLAYKNCKVKNTKMIYMAHGFHFYKGAPLKNWLLFYTAEKYLAKYTDGIITINSEDYELAKRKFKTNVYYVCGIGVDDNKINKKISAGELNKLKEDLGLTKEDFVISYAAELNENKNQKMLIDAIKVLDDLNIKLLLIGRGDKQEYYKEYVKANCLENKVSFLGFRNDVPDILKCSNMGISTSIREGLGLNVIEYMLSNLPIIVTKNRGHIDIVKDDKYIVNVGDVSELAKKIRDIYENYDLEKQIAIKNSSTVKKYLLENVIDDIMKIYE